MYTYITNIYSEFITSASLTIPSTISLPQSIEKTLKMKNKGFAQMSLGSYFLHDILDALATYGYNPVTELDKFNNLYEDYPRIAQLFKENPRISRHVNPMISNMLEKNCPTYFHRMFLLYQQYMDDAELKEQNYKSLRNFCNKDVPRPQKHFSNMRSIMTFSTFFKIVYKYNREPSQKRILDKVQTLNIFMLKKESKKISQSIATYFHFDMKTVKKMHLELSIFDQKFPYKYDLTNKNEIKKYFAIQDQSQDTILLKMFWAAVQNIDSTTGIFGHHNDNIMSKNEAINLFASILFCNKRKNDRILPLPDDKEDDDDDYYGDGDSDTSE